MYPGMFLFLGANPHNQIKTKQKRAHFLNTTLSGTVDFKSMKKT